MRPWPFHMAIIVWTFGGGAVFGYLMLAASR